jgi:hypothetical protein
VCGVLLGGVILVFYDPAPSPGQVVAMPWRCVQVAAIPAVAGLCGIAEGWLAVPRSDQWWPLTPPQRPLSAGDAAEILGGYHP